jgi:uncharacterized metal-binding protein
MMNAVPHPSPVLALSLAAAFLVVYSLGIIYLFTRTVSGRRRRWDALDFVWVPLGGLTVR